MAKLDPTSEVTITMAFIVMNLENILAGIFFYALFLCRLRNQPNEHVIVSKL